VQYQHIWHKTGMSGVAKRTGARLADFVQAGAREVWSCPGLVEGERLSGWSLYHP